MANPDTQSAILGPINPDEAKILFADPIDHTKTSQILEGIGAREAGGDAVALVVRDDEGGEKVPTHYVSLASHDLGTSIRGDNITRAGLPVPTEAHAWLTTDTQRARVEQPSPEERPIARDVKRQMGIAAADRQARKDNGLPPPVADLR